MKKSILLFSMLCATVVFAQDSLKVATPAKSNRIIFGEFYAGFGGGNVSGFVYGGTLNYQIKRDLFTIRLGGFTGLENGYLPLLPPFEEYVEIKNQQIVDYSLLYGKRWIGEGTSFSVSAGFSITNWKHTVFREMDDTYYYDSQTSLGFPFELNIKWFKKVKRRYRPYYWLFPAKKEKIAFGRSFGFKIVGNISKTDYIGLAINCGLGTHKKY